MNKYELAVAETRSVLAELTPIPHGMKLDEGYDWHNRTATAIVERLIAKGVIQSTDPDDLVAGL